MAPDLPSYALPTTLEVGGVERAIRSDYRAVLDVIGVMSDVALDNEGRAVLALRIFYPDLDDFPRRDLQEAVDRMLWFVAGGKDDRGKRRPRVMDWQQDFQLIAAPINRVLGYEVRSCEYLHWWSFLSAYYEIGDCTFAQVVAIRKKLKRGKKLDKGEREFYSDNRDVVDLRTKETAEESAIFDQWIM